MSMIKELFQKYREVILYIIFGGLAFLISVFSFALLNKALNLNEHVSNILSWIITVLFAYITNKLWVFQSETHGYKETIREMTGFFSGRIVTLLIEEAIIYVFVTEMKLNSVAVKVAAQIIVILLNYIISKLWVFNKEEKKRQVS